MTDGLATLSEVAPESTTIGIIARRRNPGLTRLVAHLTSAMDPAPAEVVVAVESPGTPEPTEHRDESGVRWLEIPAGRGLGYNRNRLVNAVDSEVLVFADDDCEPQEGWLTELLSPFADPSVDAVVGSVRIAESDFLGEAISALGFPAGGTAGYETMFSVRPDGTTDNLTTCNCAIRMSALRECGGFDESMTCGGEDTELGTRMHKAGRRLVYHAPAQVMHGARSDLGEFARWFYRRGRAKRQFAAKVRDVGPFVSRRLASYGRILHSRRRDPLLLAIFPLLVASVVLQQAGFIAETLRPTRTSGRPARPIAGAASADAGSRSLARGTVFGIAAQGWHLAAAFLLFAFLARYFGPATFGRWRIVLSVLNWLELAVNSALVKVAVKSIAGRPDERGHLVRATYLGQGLIAAALFAAAVVTAGPIAASFGDPSLAFLLRLAALDIPLYAAFMVAGSILLGEQRFERQAFGMAAYATAKLLLIGGLIVLGYGVAGALVGNALASVIGFAVMFSSWGSGRKDIGWRPAAAEARTMALASVPFIALNLTDGVFASLGLWVVQAAGTGAVLVGLYGAAATLAEIPVFLFIGLNRTLFPSVARAAAEEDAGATSRYTRQSVRLVLIVTAFGAALVAGTGRQILTLVYSDRFAGAYVPLVLLMVAASGIAVLAACSEVLTARDRWRTALGILGGATLFQLVLLVALTPRFGLLGAATSAVVAATAGALAACVALRGLLDVRVLWTLVRCALAAGPVAVALAAIAPSLPGLLVAYPVAFAGYLALLWVLGEVRSDDVATVRVAMERRS